MQDKPIFQTFHTILLLHDCFSRSANMYDHLQIQSVVRICVCHSYYSNTGHRSAELTWLTEIQDKGQRGLVFYSQSLRNEKICEKISKKCTRFIDHPLSSHYNTYNNTLQLHLFTTLFLSIITHTASIRVQDYCNIQKKVRELRNVALVSW